jgi:glycosyltransferase involved in cell wall biosynthesis
MGLQLNELFNIEPDKIVVIYNPVYIPGIVAAAGEAPEHSWYSETTPVIVAAGRLSKQKGYSYLIRAVAILNAARIPCRLIILGEGSEKKGLQDLATELGIADKVEFPGFRKNPYRYMANATLFVLSSLYEGFPNVLLEALALGVPSVATRCPTGPAELITDGVDGLLVPPADAEVLAKAMRRLLLDEALRKRLGEAGRKRAGDFAADRIVRQYEDAIEQACAESAGR